MTDTASSANLGRSVPRQATRTTPEPTGWVGWIAFAGSILALVGTIHIMQGFVALLNDEYYLVTRNGLTVHMDYTSWGWTHIVVGIVLVLAGFGVFTGQMWARVFGVLVAGLSALVNFGFIAAYPVWSIMVIAMDLFVIWALTVHGREVRDD